MESHILKGIHGRIDPHDLVESLAILAAIEARLDTVSHHHTQGAAFRIIGDWLVREEMLWDYVRHLFHQPVSSVATLIPGFPVRGAARALYYLVAGTRIRAGISASAVSFRSNMRSFYHRQQMTLWVARQHRSPEKLAAAVVAQNRFASTFGCRQPHVLECDTPATPPYLLEELASGRRFGRATDWKVLADKLVPALFQFYDHGPIRHLRAAEVYEKDRICRGLTGLISEIGWRKSWIAFPRFFEAAKECLALREETIPLCIGHGDLGKSNLVVSVDGNLALLDWEMSRELPIAEELIKLVCQHPHLMGCLEPEIRRRTEDPIALPPRRQFLCAALDIIAGMRSFQAGRPWGTEKLHKWVSLASMFIPGSDR